MPFSLHEPAHHSEPPKIPPFLWFILALNTILTFASLVWQVLR